MRLDAWMVRVHRTAPSRVETEMPSSKTRTDHDLLGDFEVPADAYYGVQTARALENFEISGIELRLYPNFIKALAMVKLAAARGDEEGPGDRAIGPRKTDPERRSDHRDPQPGCADGTAAIA
jgi:hypothetical protein